MHDVPPLLLAGNQHFRLIFPTPPNLNDRIDVFVSQEFVNGHVIAGLVIRKGLDAVLWQTVLGLLDQRVDHLVIGRFRGSDLLGQDDLVLHVHQEVAFVPEPLHNFRDFSRIVAVFLSSAGR